MPIVYAVTLQRLTAQDVNRGNTLTKGHAGLIVHHPKALLRTQIKRFPVLINAKGSYKVQCASKNAQKVTNPLKSKSHKAPQ